MTRREIVVLCPTEIFPGTRVHSRIWMGLIALGCLVILSVASLPLVDGDVPLVGGVAKNILSTGDWMTLRHPDWFVDKPPLTFWMMAISFRLLGTSEVALRLWQLLLGLGLVALTYGLARAAAATREEGLLAALVLVTAAQFFYQNTVPLQDVPLTFFLTLALYGVLRYWQQGSAWWATLAALGVALGVLTKGFVALGFVALIVLMFLVAVRPPLPHPWPRLLTHVALAGLVFAGVALPWFIWGVLHQGDQFVTALITSGTTGVGRFARPHFASPPPYVLGLFAYVPMLFVGLFPWSAVLVVTLIRLRPLWREGSTGLKFVVTWFLVIFATLSLSATDKVIQYLFPALPAVAILTGRTMARLFREPPRLRQVGVIAIVLTVGVVGAGALAWARFPLERGTFAPILFPFLLAAGTGLILFTVATLRGRGPLAVTLLAAGILMGYVFLEAQSLAYASRLNPWRPLYAAAAPLTATSDRLVLFGRRADAWANWYLNEPVTFVDSVADLVPLWARRSLLVVLPEERYPEIAPLRPQPVVIYRSPARVLLVANWRPDAGLGR